MFVVAWNNGKHHQSGNGYGLKVEKNDRNKYFNRTWGKVIIELEKHNTPAIVNIDKESFWGDYCRELISKEIGIWLLEFDLAPWKRGFPPKLKLERIERNRFKLFLP